LESSQQHFFEVRDLTVTYFLKRGAPIRALDGVNLDIRMIQHCLPDLPIVSR
jgi:hypothetical protein